MATTIADRETTGAGNSHAAPVVVPNVEFPRDPRLPDLPRLFDAEWLWATYQQQTADRDDIPAVTPRRFRLSYFSHRSGGSATASYLLDWHRDDFIPSQHVTVRTSSRELRARIGDSRPRPALEMFVYPDDENLPALPAVADPTLAIDLVNRHVLAMRPRRIRVQLVRYRPLRRAIFRHVAERIRLYARVVRPAEIPRLVAAHELVGQSEFVVPRLAGAWHDGGVAWLSEIPGKNLRRHIRRGNVPDVAPMLDGLQSLWKGHRRAASAELRPFSLDRAYRAARRTFADKARDHAEASRQLAAAVEALDPFVASWRPTSIAHNDFYDDQMLQLPDGRLAMVDFEDAGPGDPMLDVGNGAAHLAWAAAFASNRRSKSNSKPNALSSRRASRAVHEALTGEAISRFGWDRRSYALREAVCIFRICTHTIRHPRPDWQDRLAAGLQLVNRILEM